MTITQYSFAAIAAVLGTLVFSNSAQADDGNLCDACTIGKSEEFRREVIHGEECWRKYECIKADPECTPWMQGFKRGNGSFYEKWRNGRWAPVTSQCLSRAEVISEEEPSEVPLYESFDRFDHY